MGFALVFSVHGLSLARRDRDLGNREASAGRGARREFVASLDNLARLASTLKDRSSISSFVADNLGALVDDGATGVAFLSSAASSADFEISYGSTGGARFDGLIPRASFSPAFSTLERATESAHARMTPYFAHPIAALTPGLANSKVFLIVVPRYDATSSAPTPRQRRRAAVGWSMIFVNVHYAAREVLHRVPEMAAFAVFDRKPTPGSEPLTNQATGGQDRRQTGRPATTVRIEPLGQTWFFRVWTAPAREATALGTARTLLLLAGIAVSGLIFAIAQIVGRSERRARRAVAEATESLARSEERFRALVHDSSDIVSIIDPELRVLYVSPAVTPMLGYPVDEFDQLDLLRLLHPEDLERAAGGLQELLDGTPITVPLPLRVRHKDGHWVDIEVLSNNLIDNPSVGGLVSNIRDVSERKRADAQLAEARERFQSAFEHAPIGMALAGLDGRIVQANQSFAVMLDREADELTGVRLSELTHPDDRPETSWRTTELLAGTTESYRLEKRYQKADGSTVWVAIGVSLVCDAEGNPLHLIEQAEDISERKAIRDRLAHQAVHDPLTGLANRAQFVDRLRRALSRAGQNGRRVAVLFLDVDHFKVVNDSLGHAEGDRLLIAIADRLRSGLRPHDSVSRFGGDEFTVLCSVTDQAVAVDFAERMAAELRRPFSIAGHELFLTVSIGVALSDAVSSHDAATAETLVRDADAAMYQAKRLGRARIQVFDARALRASATHLQTGSLLHRALERDEMRLQYQPVIALETGRIVMFEALMRWQHPTRGLVMPAEFVPLAEETGLIVPIGRWALETACTQAARWQPMNGHAERIGIAVNLSPRQLAEHSLLDDVARILETTGLKPDALWLEITESTLMRDLDSAISALRALRSLGVHLAIDDFGTGYSSMSYLKRLPVESLKIDQTFITGLGTDPEDSAIVTACVRLAQALGLTVIAEGVETAVQLHELRALGCESAQGRLFAMAQTAESLGDRPSEVRTWPRAGEEVAPGPSKGRSS